MAVIGPVRFKYLNNPRLQHWGLSLTLGLILSFILLTAGSISYSIDTLGPAEAILVLGGAAWLIWRRSRRIPFPRTRLDLPLLFFLFANLVASVFSTDPRRSANILFQLVLYALVFYLVVDLLQHGLSDWGLVKTLFATSMIVLLVGSIQAWQLLSPWFGYLHWPQILPDFPIRISTVFGHPNPTAAYLVLIYPLGLAAILYTRSWKKRGLLVAWIVLVLVLEFFTGSRGGWIGKMVAEISLTLALLYYYRKQALTRLRQAPGKTRLLVILGVVFYLAINIGILTYESPVERVTFADHLNPNRQDSRLVYWTNAVKIFLAHPLTGSGPATYASQFMQQNSVPYDFVEHGHNYILTLSAETGLVGLLALTWVSLALVGLVVRLLNGVDPKSRLILFATLPGLAGLAMNSMFDNIQMIPALNLLTAVMLACLAGIESTTLKQANTTTGKPGFLARLRNLLMTPSPLPAGWAGRAVPLAWFGLCLGLGWFLWSYGPAEQAVAGADKGDWRLAAQGMDLATRRDPSLAFNWFQAGFAHGKLALDINGFVRNKAELQAALADYQAGFKLEPDYSTNWANYASLQWAAGDRSTALDNMLKAVRMAPQATAFLLTYARMAEENGDKATADGYYRQVLVQQQNWAQSNFFRSTPTRQSTLTSLPVSESTQLIISPEVARVGQLRGRTDSMFLLVLADFAFQRGDNEIARQAYEKLFDDLLYKTNFPYYKDMRPFYGMNVWYRATFAEDLLPSVDRITCTDPILEGMRTLREMYLVAEDQASVERLEGQLASIPGCALK